MTVCDVGLSDKLEAFATIHERSSDNGNQRSVRRRQQPLGKQALIDRAGPAAACLVWAVGA